MSSRICVLFFNGEMILSEFKKRIEILGIQKSPYQDIFYNLCRAFFFATAIFKIVQDDEDKTINTHSADRYLAEINRPKRDNPRRLRAWSENFEVHLTQNLAPQRRRQKLII